MGAVITIAQQKGGSGKTTLAVTLAAALCGRGSRVALLDTDPQGSLGRWFLTRRESGGDTSRLELSTASAWGVGYECDKLRGRVDHVIVDTPPKADADLRPALRAADLVLVPVAASQLDLWATEGVLDLCRREGKPALIVLTRTRPGTRLAREIAHLAGEMGTPVAAAQIAHRVAHAEALGRGAAAGEAVRRGPLHAEVTALVEEVLATLSAASPTGG